MMSSDKTLSTSSTQDKSGPVIPSRSSSISRTTDTIAQRRRKMSFHNSPVLENGRQRDRSDSAMTTSHQSCASSRKQSPERMERRSTSCSALSRNRIESPKVQRWAGLTRSVHNWDGLRRDPELWMQDGDCRVHLYARGASRRGPSFCVPLRALRQKGCDGMLDICYAQAMPSDATNPQASSRLQSFSNMHCGSTLVELYVPAPEEASREESFDWHITTRNFFAFVLGQPLVGRNMGQAFVDLLERMELFRSKQVNNHEDFLSYAENQGYRDLVECTDYALASLYYAERYKLRDVWIDAFAHCVGMGDSIALSPEYSPISRLTKALVARAYLEVDLHLDRVMRALSTFLLDDFSPAYLGLAQGARNHLNRFQRFLHDFYTDKFGYWPPPSNASPFPKALYKSMFYDFKSLYDLLVDTQSYNDIASQKPASGGICVLQNVDQFNKRHKFTAQIHPLPLLPSNTDSQKPTRSLSSASHYSKLRDASAVLLAATNNLDAKVHNTKIIQAYLQFERTHATGPTHREDKISTVDARKTRWLLIYGTLQYLTSALRAPSAVRDTESPQYPLCCLVAGQASWNARSSMVVSSISPANVPGMMNDYFEGAQGSSIQPDCHREDYFASGAQVQRSVAEPAAPFKMHLPLRQTSIRSFAPLASLSPRSSRRNSLTLKPISHCAIIVQGYGDGLNQPATEASIQNASRHGDETKPSCSKEPWVSRQDTEEISWLEPQDANASSSKAANDIWLPGHARIRTPLLNTSQLERLVANAAAEATNDTMSRSDSTSSVGSSVWSNADSAASSKTSTDGERQHVYKTSTAEHSGLLGGLVSVDGTRVSLDMSEAGPSTASRSQADIHPLLRASNQQQEGFSFGFDDHINTSGSIGLAISAPPSHAASSSQNVSLWPAVPATSEKKALVTAVSMADETTATDAAPRRRGRGLDIFSGLVTAPSELRDRYNLTMKRSGSLNIKTTQYGDLCNGAKSNAQPPTVTKTSHATRVSSLRERIRQDDGKKERRITSFWQ